MKKKIISIAVAAATACCACLSPVYAVEEITKNPDFESYTDNSLILSELPNQLFKLKVSEGVTKVKVEVV